MSDIESDGCEVSFKELMGAISQSITKEMVQSGAAKGKPKGKGVKPKGGAGPKGGGKGTEKKRKAQEVWDSDLSSGDDDGYGHKGKQHKTKKAGSTTERKRGGGGGASSGRGGASHEMDDIFSDDDDDDDDALLSLDASPSINDGIDSIKTDISNIWAQSESHKQASVDECKKNIEKIIKKEQEWLASVMTSGADQAEELAGIRAELSKLNQHSKKLTQDMRAVEKKTKESLDASKEKKKNVAANGVAQYRAIEDKFKKTCQDILRQSAESKAKIQATSADVEKKLDKKWHLATQVLDQIRKMAVPSA